MNLPLLTPQRRAHRRNHCPRPRCVIVLTPKTVACEVVPGDAARRLYSPQRFLPFGATLLATFFSRTQLRKSRSTKNWRALRKAVLPKCVFGDKTGSNPKSSCSRNQATNFPDPNSCVHLEEPIAALTYSIAAASSLGASACKAKAIRNVIGVSPGAQVARFLCCRCFARRRPISTDSARCRESKSSMFRAKYLKGSATGQRHGHGHGHGHGHP